MPETIVGAELCPDCQVKPGVEHLSGCDVELCTECGHQALQCNEHPDAAPQVWSGEWPGTEECRRLGWWARWVPHGVMSGGWTRCTEAEADSPDLSRLVRRGVWDRERSAWIVR